MLINAKNLVFTEEVSHCKTEKMNMEVALHKYYKYINSG